MSEDHDDYREALEAARLKALASRTGVAVIELAVLVSAFVDVAQRVPLGEESNVPREGSSARIGIPDPDKLLTQGEDMTTAEAVEILRDFLGVSAEGEARLWRLLALAADEG